MMIELSPEQLAQLADMLAERLGAVLSDHPSQGPTTGIGEALVDAQAVAHALGVDRSWVYEHASDLGGKKLGTGERPRWRFDLAIARAAGSAKAATPAPSPRVPAARPRSTTSRSAPLMAIRGER